MPKSYVLIRALVKTDAPDGTPVAEQAEALRDEVHSNLESVGEDVLCCFATAPPVDALTKIAGEAPDSYTLVMVEKMAAGEPSVLHIAVTRGILRAAVEDRDFWMAKWIDAQQRISAWSVDDDQGFDAIIELLGELDLINEREQLVVKGRRVGPGEPGYHEPLKESELRADLRDWQFNGLKAATDVLAAGDNLAVMRAFTLHHDALLAVLAKHGLLGVPATSRG